MNQRIKLVFSGMTALCMVVLSSCGNNPENTTLKNLPEKVLSTEKSLSAVSESARNQKETRISSTNFPKTGIVSREKTAFGIPDDKTTLERLKAALRSQEQLFQVSADRDTIIIGEAGTRIHIPAASFVNEFGENVTGEIAFSLIECYTPLEMFARNLSTRTVDGELLETGGSVFMDAKQEDAKLQLKTDRSLKIDFPKGEEDLAGMEEFKGIKNANGIIEWSSLPSNSKFTGTEVQNDPFSLNNGLNMVQSKGAPRVNLIEIKVPAENSKMDLSAAKLNNGEGTLGDWLEKQDLKDGVLKDRFNNGYQVDAKITFNKRGKVSEVKSTLLVEQVLLDELYRLLMRAPALKMSKIKVGEPYPVVFKAKNLTRQKDIKAYYLKNDLEWNPDYDFSMEEKNGFYTLNVQWMGWVNCDRFSPERKRIDMIVKTSEKTTVFMIFTDIESQISPSSFGTTYQFTNIPLDEPIRLIAVRVENGEVFLESRDTKTALKIVTLDPKVKASKEDIQKAFEL